MIFWCAFNRCCWTGKLTTKEGCLEGIRTAIWSKSRYVFCLCARQIFITRKDCIRYDFYLWVRSLNNWSNLILIQFYFSLFVSYTSFPFKFSRGHSRIFYAGTWEHLCFVFLGFIGKITLQIPFYRPHVDPWVISVSKLHLIGAPEKKEDFDEEREKLQERERKKALLVALEEKWKVGHSCCS